MLRSGAGVTSRSTSIPCLAESGINPEATRHDTGSSPAHLTLGILSIAARTPSSPEESTRTTRASSGNTSRTSSPMLDRESKRSVKSALEDCTRSIPVRSRAFGSYRFSGPSGIGSRNGSNEPNGECRRPDDARSG